MSRLNPRVKKNLKEYDFCTDPNVSDPDKKRHLFWIESTINEEACGSLVLGHTIVGYIKNDTYDVEYLGPVHYLREREDSPEALDMKNRVEELKERQHEQILAGRTRRQERLGIYK